MHINCNIFSFIEYYNLEGQMLDDNFLSLYFDSLVIYQDLGNVLDVVLGLLCILGIGNNDAATQYNHKKIIDINFLKKPILEASVI